MSSAAVVIGALRVKKTSYRCIYEAVCLFISDAFMTYYRFYLSNMTDCYIIGKPILREAPLAQWVKRWPADLAVPGSSPV